MQKQHMGNGAAVGTELIKPLGVTWDTSPCFSFELEVNGGEQKGYEVCRDIPRG